MFRDSTVMTMILKTDPTVHIVVTDEDGDISVANCGDRETGEGWQYAENEVELERLCWECFSEMGRIRKELVV